MNPAAIADILRPSERGRETVVKRYLRLGLLRLVFQVLRRISPRREIGGVEVLLLGSPQDPTRSLETVSQAIAFVQRVDERRWFLMSTHFRRIGVVEFGGSQFIPGLCACILARETLKKGPIHTAGVMVHELAHARLFACGFSYTPPTRARQEAICVRDAVRFLNRVAESQPVAAVYAAHAEESFGAKDPWYAEGRMEKDRKNVMTAYGVPSWLQKLRAWLLE